MHIRFPVPLLRLLYGYFSRQRRVFFEGSAAVPVQTYTTIMSGSKFSDVLRRVVMQNAMRAVTATSKN